MKPILIAFYQEGNQWMALLDGHPENLGPEQLAGFGDTAPEALAHLLDPVQARPFDSKLTTLAKNLKLGTPHA